MWFFSWPIIITQIEVETVDRTGTFLGSMWESRTNAATVLLEAGLAKMQTSFGADRIVEAHILEQAERTAKNQKLKVTSNEWLVKKIICFKTCDLLNHVDLL